MKRRELLASGAGALVLCLVPAVVSASSGSAIERLYRGETINLGRVRLSTPALAENGNSVPLAVEVESPMTSADHVEEITIFADKNPEPLVTRFRLGAGAGRARITTRIRFADSQTITAIARLSDGTLWSGTSKTIVTMAACVEPLI